MRRDRLPGALWVAWINVAVWALFYAWRAGSLVAVGGVSARPMDRVLVAANVLWVAFAVGVLAALGALVRRELGALVWALFGWIALVDVKVYLFLGVHLSSSVVMRTLSHDRALDEVQLGPATLVTAALLLVGLIAVELWLFARAARWRKRVWWGTLAAFVAAGAGLAIDVRGRRAAAATSLAVLDALPFSEWPRFLPPGGHEVHYPQLAEGTAPRITRKLSVLMIQIESLRADALEAMPRLRSFAAAHGNVKSLRHYSAAHSTEYATFALLYGLGADHQVAFTHARTPSWPLSLLKLNGYDVRAASASFLSGWNQTGRVVAQFHEYQELLGDPIWHNDRRLADYAREFEKTRDRERPFFLFLFFNSTHHAYFYPPEFEKRRPVVSETQNRLISDEELGQKYRQEVRNRYLNSVEWVDHQLGQVLDAFAGEIARGELIVVVTGDHGEELWDRGLYGHAAPTLTNARILVPLVVAVPGAPARELPRSMHADLMPTVIEALQLDPPVPPSFWSTGNSLLSAPLERSMLVHASGYPYGDRSSRTLCLVDGKRKYRIQREYGRLPRYQLISVTDLNDQPMTDGPEEWAVFAHQSEILASQGLRYIR